MQVAIGFWWNSFVNHEQRMRMRSDRMEKGIKETDTDGVKEEH